MRAARTMAAPLLSAALCGVRGGRAFGTAGETRAGELRFPHGWAVEAVWAGWGEALGPLGSPIVSGRCGSGPGLRSRSSRALSAAFLALCVKRELSPLPAALCKRAAPLGPMPNEDIDVSNLETLERYRSFTRYFRLADKESKKPRWWKTYRQHTNPRPGTRRRSCATPGLAAEGQGGCCWGHGFVPKPAL